ncbi:MAG: glycosyltransferase family 4 protein [Gaiellaceae bacterium MAG52_C11]|nr:glycosyltransferase family 4 protein [Candidatus Gaiellasilicea maunaloa]
MRVGVDATSWVNRRGFGRFARNAVGRLVESDPATEYLFYIDRQSADGADLPPHAEERRVELGEAPSEAAAAGSSRSLRDLLRLTRAVRRERLDAFLFPSVYTYFPVLGTPTVVGLHDTIVEELPDLTVPSRRERAAVGLKHRVAVRRASRLFTVSEASRAAIVAHFGIAPERLRLVPEAPDPVFTPREGERLAAGLAEAGLEPDEAFFLFAGGISPHKNVETLIEAYALSSRRRGEGMPLLVLAGDLEREAYLSSAASVRERIARHGLEEAVRLPGFVSDEALACLYSGATAVVIPSLAEGFGLPAVEAAACGTPVALSDLPPHRETLGDAALFFPPTDVEALGAILDRLIDDEALRRDVGNRARRAVSGLTWDAAAAELGTLIREAARLR